MSLRALVLQFASAPGRWTRALAVCCPVCWAGVGVQCYRMFRSPGEGLQRGADSGQQRRPHTGRLSREERRGFELRCPGCQALQVTGRHNEGCPVAERLLTAI